MDTNYQSIQIDTKLVFIIIPVHNRKTITLNCLEHLANQGDLGNYQVVVVDDGSTDGTSQEIQTQYPQVSILYGDGNLWWTGAIKKGMEYAFKEKAEYIIWLNDDTLPNKNTINNLVKLCARNFKMIATAQSYLKSSKLIYGGFKLRKFSYVLLQAHNEEIIDCDCMSGNLVCLPKSVVDDIGLPNNKDFPHAMADLIYTYQAKQSGYRLIVSGDAKAKCFDNPLYTSWSSSSCQMSEHWQILNTPKSYFYPPAYWKFCQILYGKFGAINFLRTYFVLIAFTLIRWIIPVSTLTRIKKIKDSIINSN